MIKWNLMLLNGIVNLTLGVLLGLFPRNVIAILGLPVQAECNSIVTCGADNRAGPQSGQLAAYLKFRDIKSAHVSTPGQDESRQIVAAYRSAGSELLAMGATAEITSASWCLVA